MQSCTYAVVDAIIEWYRVYGVLERNGIAHVVVDAVMDWYRVFDSGQTMQSWTGIEYLIVAR